MYMVFGYNDLGENFSRSFRSLFRAARFYVKRERIGMHVQFLEGFTAEQKERLKAMC